MINSSEFSNRLKTIMEYYHLSASAFADKIQVQRSSISHLLSGRNRPSLDFVMKVITEFDKVELYWLLNGKGVFPNKIPPTSPASNQSDLKKDKSEENVDIEETDFKNGNKLERIVFFYSDGSFKEYLN